MSIEDHRDQVEYHARKAAVACRASDLDDYRQDGWLGLLIAAQRYDESGGANLRTFAGAFDEDYLVGCLVRPVENAVRPVCVPRMDALSGIYGICYRFALVSQQGLYDFHFWVGSSKYP